MEIRNSHFYRRSDPREIMTKSCSLVFFGILFLVHLYGSVINCYPNVGGSTEPPHDAVTGNYDSNPTPIQEYRDSIHSEPFCNVSTEAEADNLDLNSDCPTMITKYGYDFETHEVTTEDGYILTMYRIKGSPRSPPRPRKIPVFLKHGIQGNCLSWLFLPGNQSLAFKLADAGYDVYLGNSRGNTYSQKHKTLDPNSDAYWDFSIAELGLYDLPAQIDYILKLSDHLDLYYIGHSLGTAEYMICMSGRPEYGLKIRVGFLMGLAGDVSDMTNPAFTNVLRAGTTHLEVWKLEYGNFFDTKVLKILFLLRYLQCLEEFKKCGLCNSLLFYFFGYNPRQRDNPTGQIFSVKYFDMTSSKVYCHVSQVFHTGIMAKFDYNNDTANMIKYGSKRPPAFELNKITAPTVVYWSANDNTTPPGGTKKTLTAFAPGIVKENNRVQDKFFHHMDFLLATDVNELVYDRILYIMDKNMYLNKGPVKPKGTFQSLQPELGLSSNLSKPSDVRKNELSSQNNAKEFKLSKQPIPFNQNHDLLSMTRSFYQFLTTQ